MSFNKDEYKEFFLELSEKGDIISSNQTFKIKLFLKRAENSLLIAKHHKDIDPNDAQGEKIYWNYWAITISYYSMLYAAKAAILSKGYEVKTHDAAQIALGYLLVPDEITKEDLEILKQSYKIFEDDYIKYFEDAKKESHIARYQARPSYTQRRLEEIFENSRKFIEKI